MIVSVISIAKTIIKKIITEFFNEILFNFIGMFYKFDKKLQGKNGAPARI
tara:strand:- start:25 stop:174 length:150 start_codon:yes stop_codon:yes gene_type:complete